MKENLMREAFVKAHALYESGEYSLIPKVFIESYQKAEINFKTGQSYPNPNDYDERRKRAEVDYNTIPTGILELDNYLRGNGLAKKELGLIMAPTSRGKSMMLKHIAEFNMLRGKNILIFTMEMSEDRYLDRFDMSLSGLTNVEMAKNPGKVKDTLTALHGREDVGKIHIKEFPTNAATVDTLKSYTSNLRGTGFFPDFIVVDYGDLLTSKVKYRDERHVLGHIYRSLRGWSVEDEVPIWGATQANRASLTKAIVTLSDISEDFSKAMISDVIIALCQTNKEKDDDIMRLFLAKNRDGISEVTVTIKTDFSHARFLAA